MQTSGQKKQQLSTASAEGSLGHTPRSREVRQDDARVGVCVCARAHAHVCVCVCVCVCDDTHLGAHVRALAVTVNDVGWTQVKKEVRGLALAFKGFLGCCNRV